MKSTTKWTAVSCLAFTAALAGSFAFGGCTVTSGTINDDGGVGNPRPDSGTDSSTPDGDTDSAVANKCPSNTKQTIGPIVNATCQAALEDQCCTELTTCFNIDPTTEDAGAEALDCNKFAKCIDQCDVAEDAGTDAGADKEACQSECALAAPPSVVTAYDAIAACATAKANTACQP